MSRFAGFSPEAGRRIWRATQGFERQGGGGEGELPFESFSYRLAYTAGGATARVGPAVGTGTAVLCYIDETGNIVQETTPIDIINVASSAVGTNKYIGVIQLGIRWKVIWEECG